MTSTLSLVPLRRFGETNVRTFNTTRTYRRHLDFVVDGTSLYVRLGADRLDAVGILGWAGFEQDARSVRRLLLDVPDTDAEGRQMLFVCPQCGDIGCGAITAHVHRLGNLIVWSDFAYENGYDADMTDRDSYEQVGPFKFDASAYRKTLTAALFVVAAGG